MVEERVAVGLSTGMDQIASLFLHGHALGDLLSARDALPASAIAEPMAVASVPGFGPATPGVAFRRRLPSWT